MPAIRLHPEIEAALGSGLPVVALETAVLTTGLPVHPWHADWDATALEKVLPGWDTARPVSLELARRQERVVRDAGALPAFVALLDGVLHIGLESTQLERLATEEAGEKISVTSVAGAMARHATAGATVSATLLGCARAGDPDPGSPRIRVMATGGIGGVHRDREQRPDCSVDLVQMARTPVCIVSSGAKSILDIPATLEALETLGVPVVGWGTDSFPRFIERCGDEAPVPRLESADAIAQLCRRHWFDLRLPAAVLVGRPPEERCALACGALEAPMALAEEAARRGGVLGTDRTPFLLRRLAHETAGASLVANLALLVGNAEAAAEIAGALRSVEQS